MIAPEVGLSAAVFGLAGLLMVALLLVNRLHACRDARRAVLELDEGRGPTVDGFPAASCPGRGSPAGISE